MSGPRGTEIEPASCIICARGDLVPGLKLMGQKKYDHEICE